MTARSSPPGYGSRYLAEAMDIDASFTELLDIARQIGAGKVPEYRSSEAFTVGAFDLAFTKLRDGDAFALLSHACREYPAVKSDPELLRGYLYLITDLAQSTNTTELLDGIDVIIRQPNANHFPSSMVPYRPVSDVI